MVVVAIGAAARPDLPLRLPAAVVLEAAAAVTEVAVDMEEVVVDMVEVAADMEAAAAAAAGLAALAWARSTGILINLWISRRTFTSSTAT